MADVTTVIGDTIRLQGNLQGDEDLTVYGRVDGTIQLSQTLIVEPSGVVKADVSVRNAVISGVVVGNITASDSVEITREGRMVGDIEAPRVILVDGASFCGQVDMGDLELPRAQSSSTPASRPSARATTVARPAPVRERQVETKVEEVKPPTPQPAAREESKPAKKAEPAPKASRSGGKKASTTAPKPQLVRSKKRRVSVKKR